jgi:hypothetical protein
MQTGSEEDVHGLSYESYWAAGRGEDASRAREERESRMMEMYSSLTVLYLECEKIEREKKAEGKDATGNHSGKAG